MPEQSNAVNSLAHTKLNCKYHIVFAPKYRRKVFFGEKRGKLFSIIKNRKNRIHSVSIIISIMPPPLLPLLDWLSVQALLQTAIDF